MLMPTSASCKDLVGLDLLPCLAREFQLACGPLRDEMARSLQIAY